MDIGFPGDRFPMEFMLGDVAIDWDVPRGIAVFSIVPREDTAPDLLVVIPLPDRNRYRISALAADDMGQGGDEDHGIMADRPGPSIEQLQSVVDRLLPGKPRLSELRWSSLFRISMRLADRYRVGNVFIAGDAAHIHPPTGGQGMNTGIQDAYNLAWKMALVVRGAADDRLLDCYEAERRPVGADTVERTREASVSFGRAPGPGRPPQRTRKSWSIIAAAASSKMARTRAPTSVRATARPTRRGCGAIRSATHCGCLISSRGPHTLSSSTSVAK